MTQRSIAAAAFSLAILATTLYAQTAPAAPQQRPPQVPTQTDPVGDEMTADSMMQQVPALLEKAKTTSDGTASIVMHRYPGNYLNLMVRVRTGIGEMHANWSDILVCIDGEADVITGGTLVDRKDQNGGESRGTRSEGGVHHLMHKGDIIHIMPGVAHWTVLEPGKNFVFWAAKIEAPPAASPTPPPAN